MQHQNAELMAAPEVMVGQRGQLAWENLCHQRDSGLEVMDKSEYKKRKILIYYFC